MTAPAHTVARPQTRKATGEIAPPLILVEGDEGSWKSTKAAELTASPQVGECFWLELGEVTADEYILIPGAAYEPLLHDGTYTSIYQRVEETREFARAELGAGHRPVVLIIDQMTSEWELLSAWADKRARNSRGNKAKLAADPDAEIDITPNYWNDANGRHGSLMVLLQTFPGIVVLIARGKDVVAFNDRGDIIAGRKDYKVEAQKSLPSQVRVWVRTKRGERARLIKVRSADPALRHDPDARPDLLPSDWSLEWLIFDRLKYQPQAAVPEFVPMSPDMTPEEIRNELCDPRTEYDRVRELQALIKPSRYDNLALTNGTGDEENLLAMADRVARERNPNRAPEDVHSPEWGEWISAQIARAPQTTKAAGWLQQQIAAAATAGVDIRALEDLWRGKFQAPAAGGGEAAA